LIVSELEKTTTTEREFYRSLIQKIIDKQVDYLGSEAALSKARRAPVTIDPEGNVMDFYGKGKDVISMLESEYEEVWGKAISKMKMKNLFEKEVSEEKKDLLPNELQP